MTDRCQGTTKSGNPCKAKPISGSMYCRQHQVIDLVEQAPEPKAEPTKQSPECGHQNLHYTGAEPMLCDLAPGHEGAHEATYHFVRYERGEVVIDEMRRTAWQDIAGTPVDQIKPDYDALARLLVERKIAEEARKLARQ